MTPTSSLWPLHGRLPGQWRWFKRIMVHSAQQQPTDCLGACPFRCPNCQLLQPSIRSAPQRSNAYQSVTPKPACTHDSRRSSSPRHCTSSSHTGLAAAPCPKPALGTAVPVLPRPSCGKVGGQARNTEPAVNRAGHRGGAVAAAGDATPWIIRHARQTAARPPLRAQECPPDGKQPWLRRLKTRHCTRCRSDHYAALQGGLSQRALVCHFRCCG